MPQWQRGQPIFFAPSSSPCGKLDGYRQLHWDGATSSVPGLMPQSTADSAANASPSRRLAAIVTSAGLSWLSLATAERLQWEQAPAAAWLWVSGLVAPIALIGTIVGGIAAWVLEPHVPWGLPLLRSAEGQGVRAKTLSGAFAATSWTTLLLAFILAPVALGILARSGGTSNAAIWGVAVLAAASLGVVLAAGAARVLRRVPPKVTLVIGATAWVAFGLLVVFGETSGTGGSAALWGVFRREELDLTLPVYALLVFCIGYQLPLFLMHWPPVVAPVLVACMGGLWFWSGDIPTGLALESERETTLAGRAITRYQRWFDADGDGFASRFGGGDCDDRSEAINPDALDVAGNGVDEDCSGRDSVAEPENKPPTAQPVPTPNVAGPAPERPANLNVVLITIDTLRYDLGYMGYQRPISPNIDALAKRATVYEQAYSLASYTSKSLGPMLIGRYGSETNRGWMHFNKYPAQDVMVQERLKAAGVFTISVQGHWYFKEDTGLGRGFDVLDMSAAPTRPQGEGDKTVNSEQISDAAIKLLESPERASQRFFMWVHYLDPHAEYVPHADFDFGSNGRARYDGEIAFTDHHVGRVLTALSQAPFADRTVVIVTSDHGEAFGEHGLIRHGFELWEELVRVPLVVYVPGQASRRLRERRSAIDLVPTMLDVFGLPMPTGDDFLSGKSMLAEWYGAPPEQREIFIDMPAGPYNGDRQAYIADDLKLVTSNSRPMGLYNLASDPGETKNLSKDAETATKALERMKDFRSKLRVVKVRPQ